MNFKRFNYLSTLMLLVAFGCTTSNKNLPSVELFNNDWQFAMNDWPGAEQPGFNADSWETINLPHDYSIEQPFDSLHATGRDGGYTFAGVGWYRKKFKTPNKFDEQRVMIRFDGIYRNSEIWINGNYLGYRPYGYVTIDYDLTPYLNKPGEENILAVKVNTTEQPNSRWYTGAGIYRDVWLYTSHKTHLVPDGVFVETNSVEDGKALISSSVEIFNSDSQMRDIRLLSSVYDATGNKVAEAVNHFVVHPGDSTIIRADIVMENPVLWSLENPNLYTWKRILYEDKNILDQQESAFGIRTFYFSPDSGFYLNGKNIKLKGTNNHHDGGPLGAACFDYTYKRQLQLLKNMGSNAIRISHNPAAPALLKAADELGFLVINEIFDEWKQGKKPAGYAPHFDEWFAADLASWMRRDRNHPSVIAWSLGNEVPEQRMGQKGAEILAKLIEEAKKHDRSRPFTAGCNEIPSANESGFANLLDLVGYNYREPHYEADHATYPNRIIYGSETVIYPYQPGNEFPLHSYNEWVNAQIAPYIAGEFLWTGFDYLGEAGIGAGGTSTEPWLTWPQWPWRSSACGVFDLCGFEKPAFWFRKALWDNQPLVYMAVPFKNIDRDREVCSFWGWPDVWPHWNHPTEGDSLPVHIYTNCPKVELLVNGKSLGMRNWNLADEAFLVWNVTYETGKIEAVGYDGDKEVSRHTIVTAGKPFAIKLTPEKESFEANYRDINYIKVEIVDEDGNTVPFADNEVTFEVTGQGNLLSVGNGNPQSNTPFKGSRMEAYHGQCLAIVQPYIMPGNVTLKASSNNLKDATLVIPVNK